MMLPKGIPLGKAAQGADPMADPMGGGQQPPAPAPLTKKEKKKKKKMEHEVPSDENEEVASDSYKSKDFSQCREGLENKPRNNDYIKKILQINKSCEDLAIDG